MGHERQRLKLLVNEVKSVMSSEVI